MKALRQLGIKKRVMAMLLLTGGMVLVLTCASLLILDYVGFRRATMQRLQTLGNIVAANTSAALAFQDPEDATRILAALKAEPGIVRACLYDLKGHVFAVYGRGATQAAFPTPQNDGLLIARWPFEGFLPVVQDDGNRVGTLYLESDNRLLYERLRLYGLVILLILLITVPVAYALAVFFQGEISRPILALTEAANTVTGQRDFSVRAQRSTDDELGRLTDAFNEMLSEVERQTLALRKAAEQLTTTLESITDGFFTVDHNWRFTYLNRESERILQAPRQDTVGTLLWEKFADTAGTHFQAEYRRAASERTSVLFEDFFAPLGIWLEIRAYPSEEGLAVYFRDVTARRIADQRLRQQEEQYRAIVEAVTNAIVIVDFSDRIVTANLAACQLSGTSLDQLIGTSAGTLVRPEDRSKLETLEAMAREGHRSYAEAVYVRSDGTELQIVIHSASFQMAGVPHLLLVISNVSEEKRLQQQLERTERMGSLGRLAANIAHEMNNVMMSILPFAEILKRRSQGDPVLEKATGHIMNGIARGTGVTQEILRFTRAAEAPKLAPIDASQFLSDLAEELRPGLVSSVTFEFSCEADLYILGDVSQLQQVVTNLVLNAVESVPQRISLRMATSSPAAIGHFAALTNPEAWAHLEISDTGQGIPPHVIGHIFEPLFTTKTRSGTGLGLAVAQQIMSMHGGHIRVDSEPNVGTTFHLLLRKSDRSGAAVAKIAPGSVSVWEQVRNVVLVEDNRSVAHGLIALLSSEGVTCEWYGAGQPAIERLQSFRPDLLVLDVGLPDISGLDVYRAVSKLYPDLFTLFSTGHGDPRMLDDFPPPAAVAFVAKPYEFSLLEYTVAQLIRSKPSTPTDLGSTPARTALHAARMPDTPARAK